MLAYVKMQPMNDQNEQKKEREPSNVRKIVCAGIFSLYCACAFILGRQLEANSSIDWRLLTVVKIVALAAILTFLVSKLFAWLNARKPISKTEFTLTTKWKVIAVLVLIIPQIVALLIMYPGCYGYDGGNHLIQYVDENRPLRKDLSVIYTVFLGLLTETLQSVKSITFGLALAMLIQSLISVFALYQLVKFVTQKTKSKCAYFFTLLFSAL